MHQILLLIVTCGIFLGSVTARTFLLDYSETGVSLDHQFSLQFVDGAELTGSVVLDRVSIGQYCATAPIGCVASSSGNWNADGVLGLGFSREGHLTSLPVFYAFMNSPQCQSLSAPVFSLMLGEESGTEENNFSLRYCQCELQLGGYDENMIDPQFGVLYAPILPTCNGGSCVFDHYSVEVESVRLGDYELLPHNTKSIRAVLDSGASCMVLPSAPWSRFLDAAEAIGDYGIEQPSIFVTIQGQEFEIPFEHYALASKPRVPVGTRIFDSSQPHADERKLLSDSSSSTPAARASSSSTSSPPPPPRTIPSSFSPAQNADASQTGNTATITPSLSRSSFSPSTPSSSSSSSSTTGAAATGSAPTRPSSFSPILDMMDEGELVGESDPTETTLFTPALLSGEDPLLVRDVSNPIEPAHNAYDDFNDGDEIGFETMDDFGPNGEKDTGTTIPETPDKDKGDQKRPPGQPVHVCIQSLSTYPDLFVLGDVFFRSVIAIHDLSDLAAPRMGFAIPKKTKPVEQKTSSSSSSSSSASASTAGSSTKGFISRSNEVPTSSSSPSVSTRGASDGKQKQNTKNTDWIEGLGVMMTSTDLGAVVGNAPSAAEREENSPVPVLKFALKRRSRDTEPKGLLIPAAASELYDILFEKDVCPLSSDNGNTPLSACQDSSTDLSVVSTVEPLIVAQRTRRKLFAPTVQALSRSKEVEYLIEVGLGTPSQTLTLMLDTGSSATAVHCLKNAKSMILWLVLGISVAILFTIIVFVILCLRRRNRALMLATKGVTEEEEEEEVSQHLLTEPMHV